MTSRREVLQLGAFGALGVVGMSGSDDAPVATAPLMTKSLLAPANMPVPYTGVFRRPPELLPYQTGFDDGDPSRPFARCALTQKLGQAQFVPGLSTTVAGYNGIFPGPTNWLSQGTRSEVRIRNALSTNGLLTRVRSTRSPTCTARRGCRSSTVTLTTSPPSARSRTINTPTGSRRARCDITITTCTRPRRMCTRGWLASMPCTPRSNWRSCPRANSTCRS